MMHDTGAIILAAGQSTRMGDANKLLLPIDGVAMVRRVVLQYRAAIDGPITVVTGHQAADVVSALHGLDVTCVHNPDFANGQQGSVAVGLQYAPDTQILLIGLGDQPLLTANDIATLVKTHQKTASSKVGIPVSGDVRGNPIVVPHALRAQLTADPARPGCMRFTRENPQLVYRHELPATGFFTDIDTPTDFATLIPEGVSTQ